MSGAEVDRVQEQDSVEPVDGDALGGEEVRPAPYRKMLLALRGHSMQVTILICMVYIAFTNEVPKITKSPAAFPFFQKGSNVVDWYRGEISAAVDRAGDADLSFVMFYAPWDAESQEVRAEFEKAAKHLHDVVEFSAVNCWQPGSECRMKFSKVSTWPILIAHTMHGRLIQYNGPKTAPHMIKFLNNVMFPYVRINSTNEIYAIQAQHDAVVVAIVDARPGSPPFNAAYVTALKFLERDPFREVAFAIWSKSGHQESHLWLHMWNETLVYPSSKPYRAENLLNWIAKNQNQITMWMVPSGQKSTMLHNYMQGPTLLMFTPHNPLADSMDYYNLLKQVALEYYNCNNAVNIRAKSSVLSRFRSVHQNNHEELLRRCSILLMRKHPAGPPNSVTYSPSLLWQNTSCCGDKKFCPNCHELPEHCVKNPKGCGYLQGTSRKVVADCGVNQFKTSLNIDLNDPQRLLSAWEEHRCKLVQLAHTFEPVQFSPLDSHDLNVSGLSCSTNISLTLLAMDSLKYHQFAERFGFDVLKQKNKTGLLLINEKAEVHHTYDGFLTDRTLREFILNFTQNNLPRALHSSENKYKYTHSYPKPKDCDAKEACVVELNSLNFLPTIMEENKVVVVFYHSKQCSFCNGISYRYLAAAKILASPNIKFARIDGDLNALPWEYTMDTLPTILLVPAVRKDESRAFPKELPITVPNLVNFVLVNLEPVQRLNAMWSICNQTNHAEDERVCVGKLRAENLAVIDEVLRAWRNADPHSKRRILHQLRQLKELHLQLALSPFRRIPIAERLKKLNKSSLRATLGRVLKEKMRRWGDDL